MKKKKLNKNSVALAGEFAVLSKLALLNLDASLTLGRTKSVDILVSHPGTSKMHRLEVKTNYKNNCKASGNSGLFGKFESLWRMDIKHETIRDPNLFYCFVNINVLNREQSIRYFIVPSRIVASYVKRQHKLWLNEKTTNKRKNTPMRTFRIGIKGEKYAISTPLKENYENKWNFK